MFSPILHSVAAGPSPEDPAEEPPEGLQPDGAAGGQRLAAPDCGLHAQLDPDHGRGQFQSPQLFSPTCFLGWIPSRSPGGL